ncbi:MAG: carbohydrate ABC transporter permease [Candidatus Bipolaricaulia bacterium]
MKLLVSERLRSKRFWADTARAYLYLLPAFVILGTFTFYPVYRSFALSLFDWDFINPIKRFIGLGNYRELLQDELFWKSLWNTVYYVLGSVVPTMALALGVAVLLNARIKGRSIFRTSFFIAYITPTVAATLVFRWIYDRDFGLVNYFLGRVGIGPIDWLNSPEFTMPAVILLSIWKYIGFQIVIFLAGLQNIDRQFYDAAKVDGASSWQLFRRITLPLLSPTIFFVLIISSIGAFKVFDEIYVLFPGGRGGPLNSSMTIVVYLFQKAFGEWRMGYASAAAYVLFFIIFILTLIQMKLLQRRVHYQ